MLRVFIACLFLSACHAVPASADSIPLDATQYKRDVIRESQATFGIGAPSALFAAQIHQESRWRTNAKSPVGAQGLAQFMPSSASWIAEIYPKSLGNAQPYNPSWAIRALVTYNKWHFDRIKAATECDRWAFILSAYNGGLGWVQKDRKKAAVLGLDSNVYWNVVEQVNAGRSVANFKENRGYPARIINLHQPMYQRANWGQGVCNDDE